MIPSKAGGIDNNHEHIRTVDQIVSGDKGGMIISPRIGLHEDVLALDYDNEYANLIVNHNLSYETIKTKDIVQGLGYDLEVLKHYFGITFDTSGITFDISWW